MGHFGHAARHRSAGIGSRDAGRDEDRRRHWLDEGRRPRAREGSSHVQSPLARNQCTPPMLHADRALAGICGLVEPHPRRPAHSRKRHGSRWGCDRHRGRLERRRGEPFCSLKLFGGRTLLGRNRLRAQPPVATDAPQAACR